MKPTTSTKTPASGSRGTALGSSDRNRAVYIDILRIFACYFVIFNHTSTRGFLRYAIYPAGSLHWIASFFFATFCKTVPLFFMISGGLLLGKDESFSKTFRRSVKILIDIVLFSLFYYWLESRYAGTAFSLKDTFRTMLSEAYWQLWYLYAYIAFILSLPIMRKIVRSLDEKTSMYVLVLAFLYLGIIPIAEAFFSVNLCSWLKPGWLTPDIFIYPVTGYIIENKLRITKRMVCQCWVLVLLCFILSSFCEYYLGVRNEKYVQSFMLVNNLTIYITAKYVFGKKEFNNKTYRILTEIGADTYGIYLLHIVFLRKLPIALHAWEAIESLGFFGVFISCACVFILAGALTWLLRRIPIIRKLF